jgi:hypothetical protein
MTDTTSKVNSIKKRYATLSKDKLLWAEHYQLLGEYVLLRKQEFTSSLQPGAFLTDKLFDSTAVRANQLMAASLLGALWPNAAKSIQIKPPKGLRETEEIKKYFEAVSLKITEIMDNPRGGLAIALEEYMLDQGCFGTSGIGVFEGSGSSGVHVSFKAWDVKTMLIDEGPDGFIDTVISRKGLTARQMVQKYGLDNVSIKVRESFAKGLSDIYEVVHIIEPRLDGDPRSFGNRDMPIASLHFEWDSEQVLRESGFEEMPVLVTRFMKAMGEKYGRSPAMAALPDIIELNTLWEAITLAFEKNLDPPLGLLNDGAFGNQVLDTSAGALNVFNVDARVPGENPVFPLFTVGETRGVEKLIDKLSNDINSAFFIDRLLDLNNDTRMTLGEAQIRNKLRGESLGALFSRQQAELFTPLVERTFNLAFSKGLLGTYPGSPEELEAQQIGEQVLIIPKEIIDQMRAGKPSYEVSYISPASRILQAEELQGVLALYDFALQNVNVAPNVLDNVDTDRTTKIIAELVGAPLEILRSGEAVAGLRSERQAQQQEAQKQEDLRASSETARNFAQAQATSRSINGQQTTERT